MAARGAPPPQPETAIASAASASFPVPRPSTPLAPTIDNAPALPAAQLGSQDRGRLEFAGANAAAIVYETGRFIKCG